MKISLLLNNGWKRLMNIKNVTISNENYSIMWKVFKRAQSLFAPLRVKGRPLSPRILRFDLIFFTCIWVFVSPSKLWSLKIQANSTNFLRAVKPSQRNFFVWSSQANDFFALSSQVNEIFCLVKPSQANDVFRLVKPSQKNTSGLPRSG